MVPRKSKLWRHLVCSTHTPARPLDPARAGGADRRTVHGLHRPHPTRRFWCRPVPGLGSVHHPAGVHPRRYPGLAIGCLVSNLFGLMGGANRRGPGICFLELSPPLVAACLTYALRRPRIRGLPVWATLPPVLINAVVVGIELTLVYGGPALVFQHAGGRGRPACRLYGLWASALRHARAVGGGQGAVQCPDRPCRFVTLYKWDNMYDFIATQAPGPQPLFYIGGFGRPPSRRLS